MTKESLKNITDTLRRQEKIFFCNECYRLEMVDTAKKYKNERAADGKLIQFSAFLDQKGTILAAEDGRITIAADVKKLIETAFGCRITFGRPERTPSIFVDETFRDYRYALVDSDSLFGEGEMFPLYSAYSGRVYECEQQYHTLLSSNKLTEYSHFQHYQDLPKDTDTIKVPFSIDTCGKWIEASPIVVFPNVVYICPLPVLVGADYDTHILDATCKLRSIKTDVDDTLMSWRYIKPKKGAPLSLKKNGKNSSVL